MHTEIKQIIEKESYKIIREDYYKFPVGISNIYSLHLHERIEWFAELPSKDDAYTNMTETEDSNILNCSSWGGFDCLISIKSGKIIEKKFTK
jgi:hypothetical protein